MSTVQSYELEVDRQRREALARERERMREEQARLEAERRRIAAQIEAQRRAAEAAQNRAEHIQAVKLQQQLDAKQRQVLQSQATLSADQQSVESQLADAESKLRNVQRQHAQTDRDLRQASQQAHEQHNELQQLSGEISNEKRDLSAVREDGRAIARRAENAVKDNLRSADALLEASAQTADLAQRQLQIEKRLSQLDRELRFVNQGDEQNTAAMVTLMAMRANNYILREVDSREGLTSYFEQDETRHQIAVRVGSVCRKGDNTEQWELLAETFNTVGDQCLYELEDFETAVEVDELGALRRSTVRVYPKDDTGTQRDKQGVIKPPQPHAKDDVA